MKKEDFLRRTPEFGDILCNRVERRVKMDQEKTNLNQSITYSSVTQERTSSNSIYLPIIGDFLEKPLEKWTEDEVQESLKNWIDSFEDLDTSYREEFPKKFNGVDGASLAEMIEHPEQFEKYAESKLGINLFNRVERRVKKDQEKAKAKNALNQNIQTTNTTTVATVNDDYKKKPLLEWDENDVQNYLKADENYCTIASKFPFNGAKLAKLKKETIQKEIGNILGEALFYNIEDILKKDQEKAKAKNVLKQKSPASSLEEFKNFCDTFPLEDVAIPEVSQYKSNNPLLNSDLPCWKGELALKFLPGDLDSKDESSQAVKDLENTTKSIALLLGVSGCGKTKALLDFAAKHFVIWFDVSQHSNFVLSCISKCAKPKPNYDAKEFDEYNRNAIQPVIIEEFLFRVVWLKLMLQRHNIKPLQWRNLQLSTNNEPTLLRNGLKNAGFCTTQNFFQVVEDVSLLINLPSKLTLVVDDASLLVKDTEDFFYCPDFSAKRPLISPFIEYLRGVFRKIWIAGKYLTLSELDPIGARIAKQNEQLRLITSFRNHNKEEAGKLLTRLLNKNVDPAEIQKVAQLFQGRSVFITGFIRRLDGMRHLSLMEVAYSWISFLLNGKEEGDSRPIVITPLFNEYPDEIRALVLLFLQDESIKWRDNNDPQYIVWKRSDKDFVGASLCFPFKTGEFWIMRIIEPIIFAAIMQQVGDRLLDNLIHKVYLTETKGGMAGYTLEYIVHLACWQLNGKKISEIDCLKPVVDEIPYEKELMFKANKLAFINSVDDLIKMDEGSLCFVNQELGPDHVWIVRRNPLVVVFIQDKQSKKESALPLPSLPQATDSTVVVAAGIGETTVPSFWNSYSGTQTKKTNFVKISKPCEIVDDFESLPNVQVDDQVKVLDLDSISKIATWFGTDAVVIRIHLVYPNAPHETTKDLHSTFQTQVNKTMFANREIGIGNLSTKYKEIRLDLHSGNLQSSGLFTAALNNALGKFRNVKQVPPWEMIPEQSPSELELQTQLAIEKPSKTATTTTTGPENKKATVDKTN